MSDREEIRPSAEQTNWAVWPMRQPHSNTKTRGRYPNPPMLRAWRWRWRWQRHRQTSLRPPSTAWLGTAVTEKKSQVVRGRFRASLKKKTPHVVLRSPAPIKKIHVVLRSPAPIKKIVRGVVASREPEKKSLRTLCGCQGQIKNRRKKASM